MSLFSENICFGMEITSPFGWRVHPVTGEYSFHTGVDIAADEGSIIPALFDGTVIWAEERGGYGNCVLLQHENDRYTLYAHCSALNVFPGQQVGAGYTIAYIGSTGRSTGPHLHLEYWVNGEYVDPLTIWQSN